MGDLKQILKLQTRQVENSIIVRLQRETNKTLLPRGEDLIVNSKRETDGATWRQSYPEVRELLV